MNSQLLPLPSVQLQGVFARPFGGALHSLYLPMCHSPVGARIFRHQASAASPRTQCPPEHGALVCTRGRRDTQQLYTRTRPAVGLV